MLLELAIKNFAIIDELNVSFNSGLQIITGETGAGKTIIINALNLVLGGKASSEYIRTGEKRAVIEAFFDITGRNNVGQILKDNEIDCSDNTLILKRRLNLSGKNTCYANGSLITAAALNRIGQELIDIHGQHQHQLLLRPETHIDFLDAFADLLDLRSQLSDVFSIWQEKIIYFNKLVKNYRQNEDKKQLMESQAAEIDRLNLNEKEKDSLLSELYILRNAAKLSETGGFIYENIYNARDSVNDRLAHTGNMLQEMQELDPNISELNESIQTICCQLEEFSYSIK